MVVATKKIKAAIRRKAVKTKEKPAVLVDNIVKIAEEFVLAELPKIGEMRKLVRRVRYKKNPLPEEPNSIENSQTNHHKIVNAKGEDMLLFDSNQNNRFVVLGTKKNLQVLGDCDYWFADGTFKTVPLIFKQLYTIHGIVHSKVIPLIYVLMSDKSESSYKNMLEE